MGSVKENATSQLHATMWPELTYLHQRLCIYAIDLYPSGYYDCDGVCYDDIDVDGICDDLEIPGCQEPWACNYNPNATDPLLRTIRAHTPRAVR